MTKTELIRLKTWRLKVLQYAAERPRNVARTCRHFGMSRRAFYKWKQRYDANGELTIFGLDPEDVLYPGYTHPAPWKHHAGTVTPARTSSLRGLPCETPCCSC